MVYWYFPPKDYSNDLLLKLDKYKHTCFNFKIILTHYGTGSKFEFLPIEVYCAQMLVNHNFVLVMNFDSNKLIRFIDKGINVYDIISIILNHNDVLITFHLID